MLSALRKRIISSVLLIIISFAIILSELASGVVITILIILGLYEFFTMLEQKQISIYKYFGIGMGAVIPISIMLRFETTKGWELSFIILALLFLFLMQFKRREISGAVVGISTTIFGILYISWSLSFLIKIRYFPNGLGLLAALLLSTKLGDIGAYLVGSRFGKTPLIPRISPKKSVEGAIGGLIFSILGILACASFLKGVASLWQIVLMGILLGLLGQLGDLSESLLKRDCQIKDSGNFIPGIGGVLDLLDSLVFTAPVFYFFMSVVLR